MQRPYEPEACLEGAGQIGKQLSSQIRAHIHLGGLRPGDQLPTVRSAAVDLGINPQVVESVYAELEREGLLTSAEGSGTFVASLAGPHDTTPAWSLPAACAQLLEEARRRGHGAGEVLEMLRRLAT
jgi:GntR family transcriptional regulator